MDVRRSSAAAPPVPTPPPPCDPLPITPALPKEVVDCVPSNWGGATLRAATGVGVPDCGLVGALAGGLVGALAGEHYADEAYSAIRGEAAQP